jgi:hypothetical protein
MNQMHLPPMKRKRAYALAEAEASSSPSSSSAEDVECEKRARNIASVVAAVGNSAGLMQHHLAAAHSEQPEHKQHEQHEEATPDDVRPMKHVVMGVHPSQMSPEGPIQVSVAQQPVYVQPDSLQQQVSCFHFFSSYQNVFDVMNNKFPYLHFPRNNEGL